MPTCAAESCVESVRSACWTPRARASPLSAARSTVERSTVTTQSRPTVSGLPIVPSERTSTADRERIGPIGLGHLAVLLEEEADQSVFGSPGAVGVGTTAADHGDESALTCSRCQRAISGRSVLQAPHPVCMKTSRTGTPVPSTGLKGQLLAMETGKGKGGGRGADRQPALRRGRRRGRRGRVRLVASGHTTGSQRRFNHIEARQESTVLAGEVDQHPALRYPQDQGDQGGGERDPLDLRRVAQPGQRALTGITWALPHNQCGDCRQGRVACQRRPAGRASWS